ncbi:MAG: nucleotidyltransferase domain-containing protein [Candidatus Bathyarchaeia archaeon]
MDSFDTFIESAKGRVRWLANWGEAGARIKEVARSHYPNCKVMVFGSIIRNEYSANSDIDVLIVREHGDSDDKIRADILRILPEAPVELHFATHDQFNRWYKRFIDAYVEL